MIGLKRGTVQLCEHEKEWEIEAQNTITRLREILGNVIKDIQHVGSTSILSLSFLPQGSQASVYYGWVVGLSCAQGRRALSL